MRVSCCASADFGFTNLCSRIVESTGARMFGLDEAEVMERRRYVGRVKREIQVRLHSFALAAQLTDPDAGKVGYARRSRWRPCTYIQLVSSYVPSPRTGGSSEGMGAGGANVARSRARPNVGHNQRDTEHSCPASRTDGTGDWGAC